MPNIHIETNHFLEEEEEQVDMATLQAQQEQLMKEHEAFLEQHGGVVPEHHADSFEDPRSPTTGIKRTPIKDIIDLNEKLDSVNFELFKEHFHESDSSDEQSMEEAEHHIHILNVLEAEDYYAKFESLKRKQEKSKFDKRGLAPIATDSPAMRALSGRQNSLHSPSGLYCLSPASKAKFGHFFPSKLSSSLVQQQHKCDENGAALALDLEAIESPSSMNVSLSDGNFGTFFSPCHTRRKLRRVQENAPGAAHALR